MLFHNLVLEAFCHETEDKERVKQALLNLVAADDSKFLEEIYEGSFGNKITAISLVFEKQCDIRAVMDGIRDRIPKDSLKEIDIDSHLTDDNFFWLRFDKQKAYGGDIVLGGDDVVQVKGKVAAFPAKRENALMRLEEYFSA